MECPLADKRSAGIGLAVTVERSLKRGAAGCDRLPHILSELIFPSWC
jgi:hypothetical protein